jgi:hypothetical protein
MASGSSHSRISGRVRRVANTEPSHSLDQYCGTYVHPAYGKIGFQLDGVQLLFKRGKLELPLEHWHYDAWVARDVERFTIHMPHAFDRSSRILFNSDADGEIVAVSIQLEPSASPICFQKQ